jgi:hypothetical protein
VHRGTKSRWVNNHGFLDHAAKTTKMSGGYKKGGQERNSASKNTETVPAHHMGLFSTLDNWNRRGNGDRWITLTGEMIVLDKPGETKLT